MACLAEKANHTNLIYLLATLWPFSGVRQWWAEGDVGDGRAFSILDEDPPVGKLAAASLVPGPCTRESPLKVGTDGPETAAPAPAVLARPGMACFQITHENRLAP